MTALKETNKALITHSNKMEIYKVLYKEFRIILLSLVNNRKTQCMNKMKSLTRK